MVGRGWVIGQPNFFWKTGTNSTADVWPNRDWTPIFSHLGHRLTTPPKLRRSPCRANSDQNRDPRSLGGVVKQYPRWLKIGVQSRFGQMSVVEFVLVFQKKKIGLAQWGVRLRIQACDLLSVFKYFMVRLQILSKKPKEI